MSHKQAQAQARWCGTQAVPKAPAGELAKGKYPGPTPSSAGVGPVPRRNTGCNNSSTAMSNNHTSRAGTAQHTQGQGRYGTMKACRYGESCWGRNGQCLFWHPVEEMKMWCKFGVYCQKKGVSCPYQHPEEREKQWCWYGLQCRRRQNGCKYEHPEQKQQPCKFGVQCRWKDWNCPFQHPQQEHNEFSGCWDPHLGVASRQAHTLHHRSTAAEASSEHAPCSAGGQNTPCRGREHLPHSFGQQTFHQPYPGRTCRAEVGVENVPVWTEVKPANNNNNRRRNPQAGSSGIWLDTWTDANYWKVLQDESQRRIPAPGRYQQSQSAQRGVGSDWPLGPK